MSYKNKDWLTFQYRELNKSIREIAKETHHSKSTIHKWIHIHGIKVRKLIRNKQKRINGVKMDSYGYILILKKEHPYSNTNGYVKEHRLIMEKHIGRYLCKDEIVHHKDGNRLNNYIGNLELTTREEHSSNHWDF